MGFAKVSGLAPRWREEVKLDVSFLWGCVRVEVGDQRARGGWRDERITKGCSVETWWASRAASPGLHPGASVPLVETEVLTHPSPLWNSCSPSPDPSFPLVLMYPSSWSSLLPSIPCPHPIRHPGSGSKRRTAFMWPVKFYYICIQNLAAEKHW